ncbi:AAEL009267-PA [Aedes aegypti]|uniref:AAEL009267-PA n=2 Tax=Aedes aegypti TaxID=7159 RepID=A0A1S4FM71_AEDAE|nr:zinc finger protein 845 [Aedes aegypti]EAT38882.1 AAEL009267-PA [Aedes aegypti]
MPKNYLSSRYNRLLHQENKYWDELFCSLFWSPFAETGTGTRTRSGCILGPARKSSSDTSEDDLAPVEIKFHDDWIFMEYPTAPDQATFSRDSCTPDTSRTETASHPSDDESFDGQLKSYKCEKCSKQFQHAHQLRTHWTTHAKDRLHSCDCGKSFKTRAYLGIHRRNTGHHNWTIKCHKCGKPFAKERHMARHSAVACEKFLAKQKTAQ